MQSFFAGWVGAALKISNEKPQLYDQLAYRLVTFIGIFRQTAVDDPVERCRQVRVDQ
ncbi:MAG: hypothetical protein ACSLFQ_08265 [Thermoanaerobaculia bacterium]